MSNRQNEVRLPVRRLRRQLERALTLLPRPLPAGLGEIAFVLVDRAAIARVHRDFLGNATETDVITFPYGEIVVCPAVAQDQAAAFGSRAEREVLLYALHGLLHLAGYDDTTKAAGKIMARAQERLLERVLADQP